MPQLSSRAPMLIALDPGPHTGVAMFQDGKLHSVNTVAHANLTEQYRTLYDLLMYTFSGQFTHPALPDPVVVIEDYRSQMTMTREGYYTVQLVGFLAGTVRCAGYAPHLQLPAARRAFLNPAMDLLKRTYTHYTPHERDATAHALAYLATHGGTTE